MIDNFFSAGELIVAQLKAKLNPPANLPIRVAPNQEWAINNVVDQAISVIFFDDQPAVSNGGSAGRGKSQSSTQFWLIVVSQKNVQNVGVAARLEIGTVVVAVLKALQGYELSPDHRPLKRERSQFRNPDKGAYVHIPLMFSTNIII
jgi:hypothetical protein